MAKIELITGSERRRQWSEECKRELVAAAFAPGVVVQDVARRADVASSLLYRWRRQFCQPTSFAQVVLADAAATPPPSLPASRPLPTPQLEITLADGTSLRVGADIDPLSLRRIIGALRG